MKIEDLKKEIDKIKPDPYMETRLAQKVAEAAPKKKSKKRAAVAATAGLLSLVLAVTALGFGGFWKNPNPHAPEQNTTNQESNGDNDTQSSVDKYIPYIGGTGGGDPDFGYAYHWKFYGIDGRLIEYISENIDANFENWLEERDNENKEYMKKHEGYKLKAPDKLPFLVEVIKEFHVPRKYFEELNEFYIKINEEEGWGMEDTFTDEEIDAIYSFDPVVLSKVCETTEYAITTDYGACSPEFYLGASQEELERYGISDSEIIAKGEKLMSDGYIQSTDYFFLDTAWVPNYNFYACYNEKLYGFGESENMYDYFKGKYGTAVFEWMWERSKALKNDKYIISDPEYRPFIVDFIKAFNISKEDFKKAIYGSEFTQAEIDALYSDDPADFVKAFANEYAIIENGKIFAPVNFVNATEKELEEYGISPEEANKKIEEMLSNQVIVLNEEAVSPLVEGRD